MGHLVFWMMYLLTSSQKYAELGFYSLNKVVGFTFSVEKKNTTAGCDKYELCPLQSTHDIWVRRRLIWHPLMWKYVINRHLWWHMKFCSHYIKTPPTLDRIRHGGHLEAEGKHWTAATCGSQRGWTQSPRWTRWTRASLSHLWHRSPHSVLPSFVSLYRSASQNWTPDSHTLQSWEYEPGRWSDVL